MIKKKREEVGVDDIYTIYSGDYDGYGSRYVVAKVNKLEYMTFSRYFENTYYDTFIENNNFDINLKKINPKEYKKIMEDIKNKCNINGHKVRKYIGLYIYEDELHCNEASMEIERLMEKED